MLEFSLFKHKESHQSFGNITAGGNQIAIIIAPIQKFIWSIPTLAQSGMNLLLVILQQVLAKSTFSILKYDLTLPCHSKALRFKASLQAFIVKQNSETH